MPMPTMRATILLSTLLLRSTHASIPLIDLADENAVKKVAKACKEIGFFAITNHGVDPAVVDGLWSASAAFFDQPEAEKNLASSTNNEEYPYGYEQSENLQLAKTGVKTFDDLKETFSVGPSNPESGMPPRRIPSHPPELKLHITSYYEAMENLALKILQIMALGLDLPPQWFEDKMDHHLCALRLLNYPNLTQAAHSGQLRAGAHTDYGIITILRSGGPGLQVKKDISGDDWVSVPDFARDVFIINLGDLMQRWTNDKWVSTLHRVVVPPHDGEDHRRQSVAFFVNGNGDANVETLSTCIDDKHPVKYKPVTIGDYILNKYLQSMGEADRDEL